MPREEQDYITLIATFSCGLRKGLTQEEQWLRQSHSTARLPSCKEPSHLAGLGCGEAETMGICEASHTMMGPLWSLHRARWSAPSW